jgi:hypothetical protein
MVFILPKLVGYENLDTTKIGSMPKFNEKRGINSPLYDVHNLVLFYDYV